MPTPATWITLLRLALVPVFSWLAVQYAQTWELGSPDPLYRWAAVSCFIGASALDGIDGWVARRFNQHSLIGSILDPLADKTLLLTGLITLSLVEWGSGWTLPLWFLALALSRDVIIIVGIWILYFLNRQVPIKPTWTGKVCTVTQIVAVSWVMIQPLGIRPDLSVWISAIATVLSGLDYIRVGIRQAAYGGESST